MTKKEWVYKLYSQTIGEITELYEGKKFTYFKSYWKGSKTIPSYTEHFVTIKLKNDLEQFYEKKEFNFYKKGRLLNSHKKEIKEKFGVII